MAGKKKPPTEREPLLIAVTADGEVTGDYWKNISAFESQAEARIAAEREAEREATNKPTELQNSVQIPKVYQHSERTFKGKLERHGEAVMSMHSQGKSIDHIRKILGMGARTIARIIKELTEEGR